MHQRFGHQDEHARGFAGQMHAVQDQARLDRFPQAHFVGQQYPRRMPVGHLVGDCKLMRNQVDAGAGKTKRRGLPEGAPVIERAAAKGKKLVVVHLGAGDAVARLVVGKGVAQGRLRQALALGASVGKDPIGTLVDDLHHEAFALVGTNGIAHLEAHPAQRRAGGRVETHPVAGWKKHFDPTSLNIKDDP